MRAALREHPVLAYCVAAFGIAWGGILLLIGPAAIPLDAEHLALLLGFGYVAMLAGAGPAAVALTAIVDGRAGLHALRAEILAWRLPALRWAAALLIAPLSIAAVLAVLSLASPDFVPRLVVEPDRAALLQYVAVSALLTGVFEELGWTGLVARALIGRHGVLRTGLIVGALMAAWNLLIVTVKELSVPTPGPLPLVVLLAVGLLTWQIAYRVLMVAMYERTRSVLMAMVMQTSLVASWTALTPLALTNTTLVAFYLVLTALWCVVAAIALRAGRVADGTAQPLLPKVSVGAS
jgi:hypothetical protein